MVVSVQFLSRPLKRLFSLLLLPLLLINPAQAAETDDMRKTMRIRAAFIYQMSKFVNWSLEDSQPLHFCLFPDPRPYNVITVLTSLERQGKLVSQGRPVKTHMIERDHIDQIEQYDKCSLIYFNNDIDRQIPPALYKTLGKTKLTIGANKEFIENGGMTALVYAQGKHKLFIHRDNYEASLVKIRSRLLSLAKFYPK